MQFNPKPRETVPVWDPLVRIFHWSLVGFFLLAYVTEDELLTVHAYAGYAVAGLIVFRLIWGLIGTRHARFSDFLTGPATLKRYLGQLLKGRAPRYVGHNPAGAAMVIALLVTLALTAFTGMALIAGDGSGPLAGTIFANLSGRTLEEVHEFCANLVLGLVVLHIAGVLISSLMHQENLVKAMVTGRKRLARAPGSDNGLSILDGNVEGQAP
jgi:cytochrome b